TDDEHIVNLTAYDGDNDGESDNEDNSSDSTISDIGNENIFNHNLDYFNPGPYDGDNSDGGAASTDNNTSNSVISNITDNDDISDNEDFFNPGVYDGDIPVGYISDNSIIGIFGNNRELVPVLRESQIYIPKKYWNGTYKNVILDDDNTDNESNINDIDQHVRSPIPAHSDYWELIKKPCKLFFKHIYEIDIPNKNGTIKKKGHRTSKYRIILNINELYQLE
ncbi:unnamed protein product, partial [Meganyctiphanes norvegica]